MFFADFRKKLGLQIANRKSANRKKDWGKSQIRKLPD
jgi:hypothetical protein